VRTPSDITIYGLQTGNLYNEASHLFVFGVRFDEYDVLLLVREGRDWSAKTIRLFWPAFFLAALLALELIGILSPDGIEDVRSIEAKAPLIFWSACFAVNFGLFINLPLLKATVSEDKHPTYYFVAAVLGVLAYVFLVAHPGFNPKVDHPVIAYLGCALFAYLFALDLIQLAIAHTRRSV
jgi:hypothetical protein